MRKQLFIILFFILSPFTFSQEWNQNKAQTKTLFSVKKLGVEVVGNFNDAEVHTNFHKNDLVNSYVNVKIRVKSISMGTKSRDKKILDKKYFCEKDYKYIQFTSSKILQTKTGDLFLIGILKIKGIAKKMQIPIEVLEQEEQIIIKSNFSIKRQDFKLGKNEFGLSNSAKFRIEFIGIKQV